MVLAVAFGIMWSAMLSAVAMIKESTLSAAPDARGRGVKRGKGEGALRSLAVPKEHCH